MEREGRSPVKSTEEMYRPPKRVFKGWRIAMSRDFPQLLSHRYDVHGAVIPPGKVDLRVLTPAPTIEHK